MLNKQEEFDCCYALCVFLLKIYNYNTWKQSTVWRHMLMPSRAPNSLLQIIQDRYDQ